jgi:Tol biopolymer transport system component
VRSTGGTRLVAVDSFEGESVHDVKWLPDGSGFLFTKQHVDFGIMAGVFEYNLTTGAVTQLTHFANEEYARNLSISPDGQQVVFDLAREFDGPSDLWIMERDGSDLRLLVANAAHPAWSWREPPALQRVYLPLIQR